MDEIKIESSEDVEVLNGFNVILIKKRVLQFVKQVNPEVSLEVEAKEISQKMSEIAEIDAAVDVVEPLQVDIELSEPERELEHVEEVQPLEPVEQAEEAA